MSIFAHAHATAAGTPRTKCVNCVHHEAMIADLQAYIEDLRQSRDRWRDLALDVEHSAAHVAADAARAEARNLRLLARLDRL